MNKSTCYVCCCPIYQKHVLVWSYTALPTPFPASSFSTIVPTKQNQLKTIIFYFFPLASVSPFTNIDYDSRTSRKQACFQWNRERLNILFTLTLSIYLMSLNLLSCLKKCEKKKCLASISVICCHTIEKLCVLSQNSWSSLRLSLK